jgi:XTP/dITP diphosphohydrolase
MKLLVATRSSGKMNEIRRILAEFEGIEAIGLDDAGIVPDEAEDALEPYDTFEENARSKAEYFFARSALPTVADDSGIEVDALGGAPGVRSRRFAPGVELAGQAQDDANNRHLVQQLARVPAAQRTARYVCVAVLVDGHGAPLTTRGEASGIIVDEPRGSGGFGYDAHVLVPELGRTYAELTPAQKDARSHRGQAFRALAAALSPRVAP